MSSISSEIKGGVLIVRLNRPEKFNSFNRAMALALLEVLSQAAALDDVRCVLLTGEGKAFCAGQDLAEAMDENGPGIRKIVEEHYNPIILALRNLEKPVIAAVNGVAAGAGANIALACDIVLAARSASFVQSFAKLGLVPDSGGTYLLPRLAGAARAMGLALLGERLTAEDAERWGLIWRAVDDARLMDEAGALARNLAAGPTKGYGLIKKALHASAGNSLDAQLDLERDLQREAGFSEDYREGVKAFMDKRAPVYKGK